MSNIVVALIVRIELHARPVLGAVVVRVRACGENKVVEFLCPFL